MFIQRFQCEICTNNYDSEKIKPYILIPCGHTMCNICIDKLGNKVCPNDRKLFHSKVINWEIYKKLSNYIVSSMINQIQSSYSIINILMNEAKNDIVKSESKFNTKIADLEKMIGSLKRKSSTLTSHVKEKFQNDANKLKLKFQTEINLLQSLIFDMHKRIENYNIESIINDLNNSTETLLNDLNLKLDFDIKSLDEAINNFDKNQRSSVDNLDFLILNISNEDYIKEIEKLKYKKKGEKSKNIVYLNDNRLRKDDNQTDQLLTVNLNRIEESTKSFYQFSTKKKLILVLLISFVLPVLLSYPLTMVSIGLYYKDECPIDRKIPIWLLFFGLVGCLIVIFGISLLEYIYLKKGSKKSFVILSMLISPFLISIVVEFILFVIVYSKIEYSVLSENYCIKWLYSFSLAVILLPYLVVVIIFGFLFLS